MNAPSNKLAPEVVEAISRQRSDMFRAMGLIETTEKSLDETELSRRYTLQVAYEILDKVAEKLDFIGSYGTDQEEEDEGGDRTVQKT